MTVTNQVIYRPAARIVLQSVMHPNKQIASLTALSILLSITNLQPTPKSKEDGPGRASQASQWTDQGTLQPDRACRVVNNKLSGLRNNGPTVVPVSNHGYWPLRKPLIKHSRMEKAMMVSYILQEFNVLFISNLTKKNAEEVHKTATN